MASSRQRDVERRDQSEAAALLTGPRRSGAPVVQGAQLSPLPLLLAAGVIVLVCLVAVDRIWEVSSI